MVDNSPCAPPATAGILSAGPEGAASRLEITSTVAAVPSGLFAYPLPAGPQKAHGPVAKRPAKKISPPMLTADSATSTHVRRDMTANDTYSGKRVSA